MPLLTCLSLLLPPWPLLSPLICTCLSCKHWLVSVSTVTTLYMYVPLSLTCAYLYCCLFDLCMSILLPLWHVLVPTVTTLIYTYLYCDHTDILYLSTVTTLICPSPYCYHTDIYLSPLLPLTCTCPLTWKWPVPVYCCHTDMCMSLLYHTNLFLSVTMLTCTCLLCACLYCFVTTLTCCSLYCYHTDLYLSLLTCLSLLLPLWPLLSPLICTCLSCYHWLVPVSTVTTLYMYVLLSLTCAYLYCCLFDLCMSLLLPFWPVHVSSVTTFTCIIPYCYHTDPYLSVLWPHRLPVPVYCYHTDLSQSLLLPHWHVPVSIVTTDLYLSTVATLTCACLYFTTLTYSCLLPCWPVHVYSVRVSTVLLPHWPVAVSTITTLSSTCLYWPASVYCYHPDLYYHHWAAHVCPVNTDLYLSLLLPHCTCMSCYHWHVHISTVTFLTCACIFYYHFDLY